MHEIQLLESQSVDQYVDQLADLSFRVFDKIKPGYLRWRLQNMPEVTIVLATSGRTLIGFKAGYASTSDRYYSWLGGVDPEFRQQGVASRLMERQHQWLWESGFDLVQTHVLQANTAMIALNLKYGFEITGMFLKSGEANYIMQLTCHD